MYNIIGRKNIFLMGAAILVGAALLAIVVFGLRPGIDFDGGTLWQFRAKGDAQALARVAAAFKETLKVDDAILNYDSTRAAFFVRFFSISEEEHREYALKMKETIPGFEELSFQSIGPSVGSELRRNATIAIVLVLLGISIYIAFAFRKASQPISSWKYGVVTLVTLFHDVIIPAGLLAVLGKYSGVEVDSNFVVALLVVMGFSVHDTIVVFDRIRENLIHNRGKAQFAELINASINQTLARSINTSLTLVLVLVALFLVGPLSLRYFILTLLVGVTMGTYSSVFVASPALLLLTPPERQGKPKR